MKVYFDEDQVALGHADAKPFRADGTRNPDAGPHDYFANEILNLPEDMEVRGQTLEALRALESAARWERLRARGKHVPARFLKVTEQMKEQRQTACRYCSLMGDPVIWCPACLGGIVSSPLRLGEALAARELGAMTAVEAVAMIEMTEEVADAGD